MNYLGIHLTLLIGPTIAAPAPPMLTGALESVEVTHRDEGRSGFQITFRVGRSGPADLLDYALLSSPLLETHNRVILLVAFNAIPRILMDGVITDQQLSPGGQPGASTLTITGEDVSVMMNQASKPAEHKAQDEATIATQLITRYSQYGLIPNVHPPPATDPPPPNERVPVQGCSDLAYLHQMADRYGYVFYIEPGPALHKNTAYWGPPVRVGLPQPALSVNLGSSTNVESISYQNNGRGAVEVAGFVQDRQTNQSRPVKAMVSSRPPLARPAPSQKKRTTSFQKSGLTLAQARAYAQGMVDAASDSVQATGELDALRYGGLLRPRGLVGVRGAGYSYDGYWYVKEVTHVIRKGEYKQKFTLKREGLGSTTPMVRP